MCWELTQANLAHQRQLSLPVRYKQVELGIGYRLDVVVEGRLVVEIKAVDKLLAVHQAQLLSYMRLGGYPTGLLMNFNREVLRNGIVRMVL